MAFFPGGPVGPKLPPPEERPFFNPDILMENCLAKATISGVMGGVMGAGFGIIMGTLPDSNLPHDAPWKAQWKEYVKVARGNAVSYAKGFAVVGAIYAGSECAIDKYRGKHDMASGVSAGCFTGAVLAVRGGPTATAVGCAGFAAFSAAIEHFFYG